MKVLILNEGYPNCDNIVGDQFVHVRVKEYSKSHEVRVFSFFKTPRKIYYEGVSIEFFENQETLSAGIYNFKPDRMVIHFYQSWMLEMIIKKVNIPVLIWVHGYEAIGWYRRLFNFSWYSPLLLNFIKRNVIQQIQFRKLIQYANKNERVHFIFVSNWMCKITERDTMTRIYKKTIIPNPIDNNLFKFEKKKIDLRKRLLMLRSFSSNKYANDISVKAILMLSKKSFFSELKITIIGEGPLFKKLTDPLRKFSNVELIETLLMQSEIPEIHKSHGIFLCPTRQDAQGVSMCEAMSSGLIPITTNNTAIPEFVSHSQTGLLTRNAREIANAIELIYHRPDLFESMSHQTAASIRLICSLDTIISKELELINN